MISTRLIQNKLTIDDSSPRFQSSGNADFWRQALGGLTGQFTWTLNENNRTINSARWLPNLEQAGVYRVEAILPASHALLGYALTMAGCMATTHI